MLKRKILWAIALLLIIGIGIGAFRLLMPVKVVAARPEHNVPVQVYGLGTLEAHTISKIGFKISGTLVSLEVDQGDPVSKGQVLARLDSAEQETRVLKAAANVEKAKAAILVAKAAEEKARSNLRLKEKQDQRRQSLAQRGVVSVEEADEKRTGADLARAELSLAAGEKVAAEAALKDAEAQLQLEKVLLSQHVLTAPYDGRIVSRHKELGSIQISNEPLFTVLDPNTIWARVFVDEETAGSLRAGQNAEIRLRSARGKVFPGRIERIDIESDRASEERCVHVAFDRSPEDYHLGEQAEAVITVATLGGGWVLPAAAVKDLVGSTGLVWSVRDERLDLHKITVGHRLLDGRYEILGLSKEWLPLVRVPSGAAVGRRASVMEEDR